MTRAPSNGAPDEGRRISLPARVWSAVVNGMAVLGTALICVLMVIICADIVARNLLGSSLPLVSEAGALLVVLIVALQLAASVRSNRLARTEIVTGYLAQYRPRMGNLLEVLFSVVGAVIVGAIAWATVRILQRDYASHEFIGVPGMGTLQTWPFRALITLGMAIAAIAFAVRAYHSLRLVVLEESPDESD